MRNPIDVFIEAVAPQWGLRRARARAMRDILEERHFEGASRGRRTSGWKRPRTDANAANAPALALLREAARDLVRNNGHAKSALRTIGNHTVGTGIVAKPSKTNKKAEDLWKAWAESTDCDSDGRNDFYGLEKLVKRTVAESGECLVRKRPRLPKDGLAIPLQLQVLEPDHLDVLKDQDKLPNGGRIIQGVEFDALGRRQAYWLFKDHPGALFSNAGQSYRVPADSLLHVYEQERPGQVRGISWFAAVLLKFKDFDDYSDATLMKQKIAACLAVFVTDIDGSASAMGTPNDTKTPGWDLLEPGMVENVPPGRTIEVVQPPAVRDHADYCKTTLREIATGLGVTYEDLTGDYTGMPFSAARMSRLAHYDRVLDWRWRILIPQFCRPAWRWAMEAAQFGNLLNDVVDAEGRYVGPLSEWTAPPLPMVDPANEGLAYSRLIRNGLMSLSEALREMGYDPQTVFAEMAKDCKVLDRLGLILDSDPRLTTQAGQPRHATASSAPEPEPPKDPADEASADEPTDAENPDVDDEPDADEASGQEAA